MRKVMVLGNCVAERLQYMLAGSSKLQGQWEVCPAPVIYTLTPGPQIDALAAQAAQCDLLFTQPLFHYGACNTDNLSALLPPQHLVTFSAPNFEAYFPDVLRPAAHEHTFPPPLEWHSRIFATCYAAGIPVTEVEALYVHHALFRAASVKVALEKAWENYAVREQGITLGTLALVRRLYAHEALFYTWNHPGDTMLVALCEGMLRILGLTPPEAHAEAQQLLGQWSFGFNQWPVITRHHKLFDFPGREYFCVGGQQVSIEDAAIGYYCYYDFHPHALELVLQAAKT